MNSSSRGHETIVLSEKFVKPNGEIELRKYTRGSFLGKGGFAKVYEVTEVSTGKKMAGKVISKSLIEGTDFKQKLVNEVNIQQMLSHPRLVQMERAFEDRENIYILLELCPNQTLNELLQKKQRLSEPEVQRYLSQLVDALKHLHSKKVIHRDVKLRNLFLTENMDIKLGDFGLSVKLNSLSDRRYTVCGTPAYLAPEVIMKTGHSNHVDIWSIGVIMYQLLFGVLPFDSPNNKMVLKKIKENNYAFPPEISVSPVAMDLISKILVPKPENRPSLEEISQHPFLKSTTKTHLNQVLRRAMIFTPKHRSNGSPNTSPAKFPTETRTPESNSSDNSQIQKSILKTPTYAQASPPPVTAVLRTPRSESPAGKNRSEGTATTTTSPSPSKTKGNTTAEQKKSIEIKNCSPSPHNTYFKEMEWNDIEISKKETYKGPFVVKWLDYASKYGIGYHLSDGSIGVIFNDQSKIVCYQQSKEFTYLEEISSDRNEKDFTYTFDRYPEHLEKKIAIFKHFVEYLQTNQQGVSLVTALARHVQDFKSGSDRTLTYVTKWTKTKQAIFFKLSSKVMQIVFRDGAVMVIRPSTSLEYINKEGGKVVHQLNENPRGNDQEAVQRINYVKETLQDLWKGKCVF